MISSGGQSGKATERAGNEVFRSSRLLGNDVHAGMYVPEQMFWLGPFSILKRVQVKMLLREQI